MRWLIVTSCTARKAATQRPVPAEALYVGEQHVRLMRGVQGARARGDAVDLRIVSARHGLVSGDRRLEVYDETFVGLSRGAVREVGLSLGLPGAFARLLQAGGYDQALVLLGEQYLDACDALEVELGAEASRVVFLCGHRAAETLRGRGAQVIALGPTEARELGCGLVGLKGEVAARLMAYARFTSEAA